MKPFDSVVHVEHFDNLDILVYAIGYPKEGESIVLLVRDNNNIIFTIVTDSYVYDGCNHTKEVLHNHDIKQINAFVWTHPDHDHSLGIVDLLKTFDVERKSKIFIPNTFNGGQDYTVCAESADTIAYLMKEYNCQRQYNLNFISLNTGETPRNLYRINIIENTTGHDIVVSLKFLAPNSVLIERRDGTVEDFNLNDLSLVYVLNINGFNYLFTGDLINQSVQFIDPDDLTNTNYIKIPHHGSDSTNKFIKILSQNELEEAISVCTVFAKDNDPKPYILKGYQNFSKEVYCTGTGDKTYGCVKTIFNINGSLKTEPELLGNAYVFKD